MNGNRCNDCRFFATNDSGYSNYTVMETEAHCLLNLNPHLPAEASYEWNYGKTENATLMVAETCERFYASGEIGQAHFDVDGDVTAEDYKENAELYEALNNYGSPFV